MTATTPTTPLPAPRARALRPPGGPARRHDRRPRPRPHRSAGTQRIRPYDRPARPGRNRAAVRRRGAVGRRRRDPCARAREGPPRTVPGPRAAGGVRLPHRARAPRTHGRVVRHRPRRLSPAAPLLARRAGTLSGGEQRMLALSRALLARARVVLVDEPAQGMSPAVAARTYRLLSELDACVVVAEQRLPPVLHGRAALVYELRRGAVVFSGESGEWERRAAHRTGSSPSG